MSDALQIPIGADLSDLQAAFQQINNRMSRLGNSIGTALGGSNAAFSKVSRSGDTMSRSVSASLQKINSSGKSAFSGLASHARSAGMKIRSAFAAALPVGGAIGGIGGLAGGFALAMKSISSAAEMETLETAFAPLLGSADAAKSRIAELSAFAASTPFELPEVAQSSRVLETLTKGALSTGDGLRLIGDVAAATQQPFNEMATWIGRLYDGLQSGRPVGEALARLQELGIVSGDVRGKIESLQKSGAAGGEVWNVAAAALSKFSGSMALQSETWSGKLSTLRDDIGRAMAEFGRPILDAIKPFITRTSGLVKQMTERAAEFGRKVGEAISYVSAAFSSGNLIPIIGSSLKLAFGKSVNFLYAAMKGAFNAVGQYWIEMVKTGITILSILTTADFWKGLGNALAGIFLDAVAFLQKGLAEALEILRPAAELFGKEDSIDKAQSGLRQSGNILREEAAGFYGKSSDQLGPLVDQYVARLGDAYKAISDKFIDGFNSAGEVMNLDGIRAEISTLQDKIKATITEAREAAEKTKSAIKSGLSSGASDGSGEENEKDDKKKNAERSFGLISMNLAKIGGGGAAVLPGVLGAAANGLRPAMNSLSNVMPGASLSSLSGMLVESKKQTGYLKQITKNTARDGGSSKTTAVYA